jgi:hypothetical protein
MTDARQDQPPSPAATLASALGTLTLGALLVDYTRAWLLVIPVSFLLAAFAAGTLLCRLPGGSPAMDHPWMSHVAVRIGAGVALLSLCATLGALAGVLWVAGLVTLLLVAVGLVMTARAIWLNRPAHPLVPAASGMMLGVVWLIAWLWATIPPVFYDELAYHLVIPERALATGTLPAYPWVWFTLMPYASDLLLAWGMAIGGELGARALHWSFWAWSSLAMWELLDALLPPRSARWAAVLATGALASSPMFWFLGTLTFAETCLTAALLTTACIVAMPEQHPRPWLTAGLLLGLAATVKLSGLAWIVAGLAAGFVLRWPARHLVLAALIAAASGALWWGRAAWLTGNPIYPLAHGWLGGGGFWDDANQALLRGDLPPGASDLGIAGMLRLPWDLVMHPERFGSASDAGALAVVATGTALLFPLLTRLAQSGPRMTRLGDAASAFILLAGIAWAVTTTTTRFFAPALLLGLVAVLGATLSLREAVLAPALAVVMLSGAWGTIRFLDQHEAVFSSARAALGKEPRDSYLARHLDHYDAARFVQEHVPRDAKLLFIGEARPYYFSREAIAPYAFDRHPLDAWVRETESTKTLAERLAHEKITHVILNIREFRRLHDKYGVLKFSGEAASEHDNRLKQLPRSLRQVFEQNRVYVFEVPTGP